MKYGAMWERFRLVHAALLLTALVQSRPMNTLDSLVGNTEAFPILKNWAFFNHAGVSPLPHAAAKALIDFAVQGETAAYLNAQWHPDLEKLRQLAARFINAHRDEIAFVKNTSEGLSTVAAGVDWRSGDRIITTNVEYPANIYPWMQVAKLHGAELVMVAEETASDGSRFVPIEKILEAAAHPRTRMVTLSHIEFASGQRHDMATIGRYCRERGILFCVDAIQSLGVVEVDVVTMCIDYLSADGHKWMLGPEGAGIFYCRRELLDKTRPLTVGWMNVADFLNFGNYDFKLRVDAGRFECGSHPVPGLLALKESLTILDSIPKDQIANRIRLLGDRLIAGIRPKGYSIVSPRTGDMWSGNVSFTTDKQPHDAIVQKLRTEHKIEIASRVGRLRCSAHFYNTEEQIDRLIEALP
jgi:selenocysteine lyase/cysteine desulfurase